MNDLIGTFPHPHESREDPQEIGAAVCCCFLLLLSSVVGSSGTALLFEAEGCDFRDVMSPDG